MDRRGEDWVIVGDGSDAVKKAPFDRGFFHHRNMSVLGYETFLSFCLTWFLLFSSTDVVFVYLTALSCCL